MRGNRRTPRAAGDRSPLTPGRAGVTAPPGAVATPSQFRSPPAAVDVSAPRVDATPGGPSPGPSPDSLRGTGLAQAGSEELCLSADEEDEEYNRLAPGRAAAGGTASDPGAAFGVPDRPFGDAAAGEDGPGALFPALADDRDPWPPAGAAGAVGGPARPAPGRDSPRIQPMAHETQEELRAWTPSPKERDAFTFREDRPGAAGAAEPAGGFVPFEPFEPGGADRGAARRPAAGAGPPSAWRPSSRPRGRNHPRPFSLSPVSGGSSAIFKIRRSVRNPHSSPRPHQGDPSFGALSAPTPQWRGGGGGASGGRGPWTAWWERRSASLGVGVVVSFCILRI